MKNPLSFLIALCVPVVFAPGIFAEPAAAQPARLSPNAALVYWRAFALRPDFSVAESSQIGKLLEDPARAPLGDASLLLVRRSDESVRQLRRAADIDAVDWGDLESAFDTQLPHVFLADQLAAYALVSARFRITDGDLAGGVDDLVAAWRLGRNVSVGPAFMALAQGLGIERRAFDVLTAHLKDLDEAALRRLDAGLKRMPPGGTMAAIAGDSRNRLVAVIKELDLREGDVDAFSVLERHFGTNTAHDIRFREEALVDELESMRVCADKAAALLQIPDKRFGDFRRAIDPFLAECQAARLRHTKTKVWGSNVTVCTDVTDRFFEANTRVLLPMAEAAVAYRLGGEEAFRRVADPFGAKPFGLAASADAIEVTSELVKNMNNDVARERFPLRGTAPAESGGH